MNFLDNPARYTRASRIQHDPVSYASAIERQSKPVGYGLMWWAAIAICSLCAIVLMVVQR